MQAPILDSQLLNFLLSPLNFADKVVNSRLLLLVVLRQSQCHLMLALQLFIACEHVIELHRQPLFILFEPATLLVHREDIVGGEAEVSAGHT